LQHRFHDTEFREFFGVETGGWGVPADAVGLQEGKGLLFCEQKRSKKTLVVWGCAGETARASDSESFLLLFFKKEALPLPSDVDCP
jgi:hypothetical protein